VILLQLRFQQQADAAQAAANNSSRHGPAGSDHPPVLLGLVQVVQGNFCEMPFPPNTFDAVYAIEATCHGEAGERERHPAAAWHDWRTSWSRAACCCWLKWQLHNVSHTCANGLLLLHYSTGCITGWW
jgi:hypothetical protein